MSSQGLAPNIDAETAAEILGCSYITVLNLIKKQKIKAKKNGKSWLVDALDVQKAKRENLITPRPRKNKQNITGVSASVDSIGQEEIELRLKLPKHKYQLINLMLESVEKKNLKQHLELSIDQLYLKIQKRLEGVNF